ncbi:hypothetical protein MRBLPE1_002350 [Paenibacillus sp. LPE1-1-1.1]
METVAPKRCDTLAVGLATIAAGFRHTVGLNSDGTVTAVGDNKYGQCDVRGWRSSEQDNKITNMHNILSKMHFCSISYPNKY